METVRPVHLIEQSGFLVADNCEHPTGFGFQGRRLCGAGFQLERHEIGPQAFQLTANRVIGRRHGFGLATGLFVIWAFGLTGTIAGVVFLQAAMPVAVFNFIFAERYGRNPEKVAAVILLSTLISFATLPLLVGFALQLASPA